MKDKPILTCTVVCPSCSHAQAEQMPSDYCLRIYDCRSCATVLKTKGEQCCVFCAYGDVKCPPVQIAPDGCCG